MDIINLLYLQLSFFKKNLENNLADGLYIESYWFCEKECQFLNKYELRKYLTETKVNNSTMLKSINKLCAKIIDLWNNCDLEKKQFDLPFKYTTRKGIDINETTYFLPIYIYPNKFIYYYTTDGKKSFLDQYSYKNYSLQDIAHRCNSILNTITAFYPDFPKSLENNKEYPFYCKVGALIAQGFVYKEGFDYFYNNEKFESASQLSKFVTENILTEGKAVRQYFNDTLSESGIKNFYNKPKQLKAITSYCKQKGLDITPEFKSRCPSINN